jgi:hypothetical protein
MKIKRNKKKELIRKKKGVELAFFQEQEARIRRRRSVH